MSEVLCSNGLAAAEKNAAGALATATGRAGSDMLYFVGTAVGLFLTMAFLTALAISVSGGVPWYVLALLFVATLASATLLTTLGTQAWALRRHMGMFVFDPRTRSLSRRGGESYSFDDIVDVRASSKFAAELRTNANVGWWLLVETKSGPTLRIYRGSWTEVRLVAAALAEMGLPLEGDLREQDGVLLRTPQCLVRKDEQGRLVLENPMRTFKLVSPVIITVWLLFSFGYFRALASGNWCVLPFCLFFAVGIGVGAYNLVQAYRRAGIYVVDPEAQTLTRDGNEREGFSELESVTLGAVSFRGMRMNPIGPTAVAAVRGDGTLWLLHTGLPGDVRFVGEQLTAFGLTVREAGKEGLASLGSVDTAGSNRCGQRSAAPRIGVVVSHRLDRHTATKAILTREVRARSQRRKLGRARIRWLVTDEKARQKLGPAVRSHQGGRSGRRPTSCRTFVARCRVSGLWADPMSQEAGAGRRLAMRGVGL